MRTSPRLIMAALAFALLAGCKNEKGTSPENSAPAAAPSTPPESPPPQQKPSGLPLGNPRTMGHPLAVLPGEGLGPIRFGSTFDSVARHMTRPCDERTETRCLYVDQAVDFTMKDGAVDGSIYVVRRDRPAPPRADGTPRYFGTFFGAMMPDISLGVHKHIIEEELEAPARVEKLAEPDQNGTVERHFYDGLVLEFDRLPNGSTVLGALRVVPSKTAKNPYKRPSTSDKLGLSPERAPLPKPKSDGKGAGSDFLNPAKPPSTEPEKPRE